MSSFKDKVRKDEKILQPTQRGFDLRIWREKWDEETYKSDSDANLFLAGNIIYQILQDIRVALSELYKSSPNITNEELLIYFSAMSNRNRAVLSKTDATTYDSVYSATIKTPTGDNDLTLQEAADYTVDGYQNVISNCLKRIRNNEEIIHTEKPMDTLEFAKKEALLSQLCSAYESYWRSLLWGEFVFKTLDIHENIYAIVQEETQLQIDAEYSQIRKQKLAVQTSQAVMQLPLPEQFIDDKYLQIKKSGRKQRIISKRVAAADAIIIQINSDWRWQETNRYAICNVQLIISQVVTTDNVEKCSEQLQVTSSGQYMNASQSRLRTSHFFQKDQRSLTIRY